MVLLMSENIYNMYMEELGTRGLAYSNTITDSIVAVNNYHCVRVHFWFL